MKHILIVANQTAGGSHLSDLIRARIAEGPCRFRLVVPATPPAHHLTWTEGEARTLAVERMQEALIGLRGTGAVVEGEIGDPNPLDALADAMLSRRYDEIIVSTLPPGLSRWLRQDLPRRIQKRFGLTVTHVVAHPAQT